MLFTYRILAILLLYSLKWTAADNAINNHPSWRFIPTNECGKTRFFIRSTILYKKKASLGQFPWMARLDCSYCKHFDIECSGTLISRYYVLSAAHCDTRDVNVVKLGVNSVNKESCDNLGCAPPSQDIRIKEIYRHAFIPKHMRNDIMLILLRKAALFNDFVQPACLPRGEMLNMDLTGKHVVVSGWGMPGPRENSFDLMYARMPVLDRSKCDSRFSTGTLSDKQYCVGHEEGTDVCDGDSGGPMTAKNDEKRSFIFGIASYGIEHCAAGPSVFTSVASYMKWILDTIRM